MGTQVPDLEQERPATRWNLAVRTAFRFCFVYFGLYCLGTQILTSLIPLPNVDIPDPASSWPIRHAVVWIQAHVLRIPHPVPYVESGSGDKIFDWALVVLLLIVSFLATTVWAVLDRKRENYRAIYKWFWLFIRFALAGQMITYGMVKAIPTQMPFPNLIKMLEPFRDFSPAGVLWSSIGASPAYEIFAGCAELLGGILLITPRTVTLGALVCLADMTMVFMLNMAYDVPVKLLSFHLVLLSFFLLAPECNRLIDFFLCERAVGPPIRHRLFRTPRANRIALAVQILFAFWLLGMNAWSIGIGWKAYGGGRPKSPLYGIWSVEEQSIDGQLRAPLLNDYDRWHRAVFDFPERVTFQRMDDSFLGYGASIDQKSGTITLTSDSDKNWKGNLTFQRAGADQLLLDGAMGGHKMHMRLVLMDTGKFLLLSRGFHWVQENPVIR